MANYLITNIELIPVFTLQLIAILNPISVIPTYLALTEQMSNKERHTIIVKAVIIIILIGSGVLLIGRTFLNSLGVTLDAFRFAGGALLLLSAIDMFSGMPRSKRLGDPLKEANTPAKRGEELTELAAVPLATPLLPGPGTITLILTLALQNNILVVWIAIIGAVLVSGIILLISIPLTNILHESGIKVLGRLMSLVVAAVAIEFIHIALLNWGIAKQ